jgi:hypothetical protein
MFWRIIGIASLSWGGIVFYILSTTPLPASPEVPLYAGVEFTIYILSLGWLIASSLVKVGLILKKRWIRISIISCLCFIFLLINMGFVQMSLENEISPPADQSPYPYNLVASWFISWFWIDLFLIVTRLMEWIGKKQMSV